MKNSRTALKFEIVKFILAILLAFSISFIILFFTTDRPLIAIIDLFRGPLTSIRRFSTVIETMIPLSFAGLAVAIMFRADQFNLSAEGAMFMSGLVATLVAIYFKAPPIVVKITALLLAGIVGSLICTIPGILKVKWGASELVSSIMLNSAVMYLGLYIFSKYGRDPDQAFAASYLIGKENQLAKIIPGTRFHSGFFIMVVFVILMYVFMFHTRWGFNIRLIGSNRDFSRVIGLNTGLIILLSQLVGGFIAGVGGGVEILGIYSRFQWISLPGYGFDGVIIATLAKNNPKYVPIAAFFLSYVRIGADYMYRQSDVAPEIVAIIQGTIIILIAADAFLSNYKHKLITRESKEMLDGGAI